MSRLKELTAKANAALSKMEELRAKLPAEGVWETPEERSAWDASCKDYDSAKAEIDKIRSGEEVRKKLDEIAEERKALGQELGQDINRDTDSRQAPNVDEQKVLFGAWARSQYGVELNKRERSLCERYRFNPNRRMLDVPLSGVQQFREMQRARFEGRLDQHMREQRALNLASTTGGEMVGRGIMPQFERAMLDYSGMMQASTLMVTSTGATLDYPTVNDTGNKGALLAINTAAATNVDPATAEVTFDAFKATSRIVQVPTELIEDDEAGLVDDLPGMLGERLSRTINEFTTIGTGSSQPNGVATAAAAGVAAASATAITADEIIRLMHSVDPAYRANGAFMMNDLIVQAIRLLKDTTNQYLWQPGMAMGQPDRLLGYRVFLNQDMASTIATTNRTILFGDFSKYRIRMVRGVRFYRLTERYRDADQDGFVAFVRFDGDLLNAGVAPVRRLTQA